MTNDRLIVAADSHQLSAFQSCRQKYKYETVELIGPKKTAAALNRGTLWHLLMEEKVNGTEMPQLFQLIADSEVSDEDKKLITERFLTYTAHWAGEKSNWEIIGTEVGFDKILYQDDNTLFVYRGKVDLIFKLQGLIFWLDYKTQNPKYAFGHYHYTNQFLGYSWAIGGNRGMIDYTTWALKVTPDNRDKVFRREVVSHSADQLKIWRRETIEVFREMALAGINKKYPKSRAACDAKYKCPFTGLCETTNPHAYRHKMLTEYEPREAWRPWNIGDLENAKN